MSHNALKITIFVAAVQNIINILSEDTKSAVYISFYTNSPSTSSSTRKSISKTIAYIFLAPFNPLAFKIRLNPPFSLDLAFW